MSEVTGFRRIGLAGTITRGRGIFLPRSGDIGGGGEYGAIITDDARAFAILREPVGFRIVVRVAHDIFDNWFNLELKEGNPKASEEFDQKVQKKLSSLNAKAEWSRLATYDRGFGYGIMVLGYVDEGETLADPLKNPTQLLDIKAYAKTQITSVKKVKDETDPRYGLPELYYIQREGITAKLKVHHSRVIHVATRLYEKSDWEGRAVLDNFWDDMVTLRNIRWSMGQTMFRYGPGFPDLTFTGAEQEKIDEYIESEAFKNITARTYWVHSDDVSMEFKGAAGRALNPMLYYLPIMENISCASGIPLAILRGAQAGALTGSQVNEREYYSIISDEQSAYEPGIRELINIILQLETQEAIATDQEAPKIPDWTFNWKGGFELTEEQKADIELKRLEAIYKKVALTRFTHNEVRKMIDPSLDELSEEEGGDEIVIVQPMRGNSYMVTEMRKERELRP